MFDLQEFLSKFDAGDVRQSIIEVDESEQQLSGQPATEFQSQGSGLSLSQQSDGKSLELNTEANTNNNNNNNNNNNYGGPTAVEIGDNPHDESLMSMDDILAEFDAGVNATITSDGHPSERSSDSRPAFPTLDSSGSSQAASAQGSVSHNEPSALGLPVQHRRQHSRSFNSGLNELQVTVADEKMSMQGIAKSQSTEVLKNAGEKGKKEKGKGKSGKGKGKGKPGKEDSKKKQVLHRSSETLASGREDKSHKPPTGKSKRHKLVFEPRGPLYGGGELDLRRRCTSMASELSMWTSEETAERVREKDKKRHSFQPLSAEGSEPLSLSEISLPMSDEESYWQEYGHI